MKKILAIVGASVALGAAAMTAVVSSPQGAEPAGGVVSAAPLAGKAGINAQGWVGDFSYPVPTGAGGVFFHYPCPGTLKPDAGKFDVDFGDPSANTIHLIASGLRTDVAS